MSSLLSQIAVLVFIAIVALAVLAILGVRIPIPFRKKAVSGGGSGGDGDGDDGDGGATRLMPYFEIKYFSPAGVVSAPLYEREDGFTIGSGKDADFRVNDPYISHIHARVGRDEKGWFLVDAGSKNHVFSDGKQVGQVDISEDADTEVYLGPVKLLFCSKRRPYCEDASPRSFCRTDSGTHIYMPAGGKDGEAGIAK